MSSSIASTIEMPMATTEGNWNIRIILEDDLGAITNLGPNDLANLNFQNYIYVSNTILRSNYENMPNQYLLHQNYPNPFNPITTLRYNVPEKILVSISIFDISGNPIKMLVNEVKNAGFYSARWGAINDNGQPVSAGVYFYKIQAGNFVDTKKMILIK